MQSSRYVILAPLVPVLGLSWLLLAALEPAGPRDAIEHIIIGYLLGTMFGQTTLAAAWTALGPAPLLWRLPLSLGWVALLTIAFLVNLGFHGHGGDWEVALIMAACLGGQWLLVQLPVWILSLVFGIRVRHRDDPPESIRERQFGIRQLMILTAIVAVVLGVLRVVVAQAVSHFGEGDIREMAIFVFLAVAGIVMSLPLLLAALLPRWAWLAVPIVLALIVWGTWHELPLVMKVYARGGGPNIWDLAFINAFQAIWVLAIPGLLRLCGYRMWHSRDESPLGGKTA